MPPSAYKDGLDLEAAPSKPPSSEKEALSRCESNSRSAIQQQRRTPRETMSSASRLLLVLSLSLLVAFGIATAVSPAEWARRLGRDEDVAGESGEPPLREELSFGTLLDHASPESIHSLLHKYFPDRFKHGIWSSERSAIEAVRRDDAGLATSIAQLAKRDNKTSTPVTTTPTTTPPPVSSESDPTSDPPPPSSTTSHGDDNTSRTASHTDSGTTSGQTSDSSPPPPPPTSTGDSDPPPPSSTEQPPTTSHSTSSPSSHSDPPSSTDESTTPPKPTTSSSRHSRPTTETFTSTNSDGAVVIVTATSFVWADPAQTDTASSTRPSGSLQTNAAALRHGGSELLGAVAAGVVAGGMLLM